MKELEKTLEKLKKINDFDLYLFKSAWYNKIWTLEKIKDFEKSFLHYYSEKNIEPAPYTICLVEIL